MTKSITTLLVAGLMAATVPAMAAKKPATMDTCNALSGHFDAAAKANPNAPKLADATKRRDKGMEECKAGKYDTGVKAIRSALAEIGAKTPVHPAKAGAAAHSNPAAASSTEAK
jgi:hypothetical protein